MSHRYGQTITWGTATAPQIFGGIRLRYSYGERLQEQLEDNEAGDFVAALLHSKTAPLSFEAKVTDASTNFLDLSAGAKISVTGLSGGTILCRQAVDRWTQFPSTTTVAIDAVCDSMIAVVLAGCARRAFAIAIPSAQLPPGELICSTISSVAIALISWHSFFADRLSSYQSSPMTS